MGNEINAGIGETLPVRPRSYQRESYGQAKIGIPKILFWNDLVPPGLKYGEVESRVVDTDV